MELVTLLADYKLSADEKASLQLWDRQESEPEESFNIFTRYYLPLGITRTLRMAWRRYWEEHRDVLPYTTPDIVPAIWTRYYNMFIWLQRANAYDTENARIAQLLWIERQEQVRKEEWALYLKLKEALNMSLDSYLNFVADSQNNKGRPRITSLDIERLAGQVTNYGRYPTGMPLGAQVTISTATPIQENIEDTRIRRWELLHERLASGNNGNIIEGQIVG